MRLAFAIRYASKFTKPLFFSLLAGGVLYLSGCTSFLSYAVTYPPLRRMPENERKVLVASTQEAHTFTQGGEGRKEVLKSGAETVVQSSHYSFGLQKGFSTQLYPELLMESSLHPTFVDSLLESTASRHLLVMTSFDAQMIQDEVVRSRSEEGTVNKEAYYSLQVTTYWKHFRYGEGIVDVFPVIDRRPHSSRSVISGLLAVGPSLKNASDQIYVQSRGCGEALAASFVPQQMPVSRPFFHRKQFADAYTIAIRGNYEEAIRVLEPHTKLGKVRDQSRAFYNMALCYEAQGDIATAERLCLQASQMGNGTAHMLLPELQHRIR
jgi:hypothetical protein